MPQVDPRIAAMLAARMSAPRRRAAVPAAPVAPPPDMAPQGMPTGMSPGMKRGGRAKKMADGGMSDSANMDYKYPDSTPVDEPVSRPKKPKPKMMSSGGSASSRGDGIASRGKTVGKFC